MKIRNPKSSFVFFMIILAASIHLSSCGFVHRSLSNEAEETMNTEFPTWHSPAESPEESRAEKSRPVYQVSYRAVPGGPNPLHN
ncbi:CLAVATA3/ESR-RELATED 14 [Hibiscus trionum]|uniref:CLAVATA3/ESR-RELATED 14 n=1 Tax=Hibiscus trionum TaxID=183268 RepID=A0A9W7IYF1_HIBTR|nr:CLAVATA3/ESR-RELATED 14 [Hibiscus trionum]